MKIKNTILIILIVMILTLLSLLILVSATTVTVNTASGQWQADSTPGISVTCTGNDTVYQLTLFTNAYNVSAGLVLNTTDTVNATNNTATTVSVNIAVSDNNTGAYQFLASCIGNSTGDPAVNASTSITILIDTTSPSSPVIQFPANSTCVDATPEVQFTNTTETNFLYYNITVVDTVNTSLSTELLWYSQYNTSPSSIYVKRNLTLTREDSSYNLTVIATDKAGNTGTSNVIAYSQNSIGYSLRAGWNILGIVRSDVGGVTMSTIATETGASVISWYNNTAGTFKSYTVGSSTNENFTFNRSLPASGVPSRNAVFIYMTSTGNWGGCGRNFSTSQDWGFDALYNNSNNAWNVVGIVRPFITFIQLNNTFKANFSDVMSYFNNSDGKYSSYFANVDFNKDTNITRGEVVFIRMNDTSRNLYNWTNQTNS